MSLITQLLVGCLDSHSRSILTLNTKGKEIGVLTAVVPDKFLVPVLVFLFAFGVCSASGLLKRGVEISIQSAHKHLSRNSRY